jgi:hypothetical protein
MKANAATYIPSLTRTNMGRPLQTLALRQFSQEIK